MTNTIGTQDTFAQSLIARVAALAGLVAVALLLFDSAARPGRPDVFWLIGFGIVLLDVLWLYWRHG